jgi:hypothetical protein
MIPSQVKQALDEVERGNRECIFIDAMHNEIESEPRITYNERRAQR